MGLTNRKVTGSASDAEFNLITEDSLITSQFAQDTEEEFEIDLIDLAYMLLDKIHYILLFFLAGALLFNAFAYFCVHPTYESTAKMYIVSASNDSVVDLTDLNIGTSLTSDYEQLIFSYPVLEQVIKELDLDMTSEELTEQVTLENPADTRILNITAVSTDPQEAKDIANKIMEVSIDYLPKTMSTNPPNVAQQAKLADKKAGPSYAKYTLMGAFLAAILYCAYLIMKYLMDDTIHTPEEMEKYFGVVPLTTIPDSDVFEQEEETKPHKKSLFRRGKKEA